MNVATVDNLSDALTRDMTWRIREISDLKQAIRIVPDALRQSAIRAAIPIFYAHWEGHVRTCASGYVQHISLKQMRFGDLCRGYMLAALKGEFARLVGRSMSKVEQMDFIDRVFEAASTQFKGKSDSLVDTRSNLSYATLCEILHVIGVQKTLFDDEESFIDRVLLDRRNNIAHGQNITLSDEELEEISNRTISLMRTFRNLVENAALTAEYRRPPNV